MVATTVFRVTATSPLDTIIYVLHFVGIESTDLLYGGGGGRDRVVGIYKKDVGIYKKDVKGGQTHGPPVWWW